jgi:hypothetical protein
MCLKDCSCRVELGEKYWVAPENGFWEDLDMWKKKYISYPAE